MLITALFTGMVLALQTGFALARFGAKPYVGSVVGLSLARELGPVLTALMVGGRVGAGITAELGAMQVTEQVDAIRSLGANPVQKLVLPRVIAATLALPLLTVLANLLGIFGGLVISASQFHISPNFYVQTVLNIVTVEDFLSGIAKTLVFGWIIAMVGLLPGAARRPAARSASGSATTRTVVVASIARADLRLLPHPGPARCYERERRRRALRDRAARTSRSRFGTSPCCAASTSRSAKARPSRSWAARAAGSRSASST